MKKTRRIGDLQLETPFLLAPLAGITDAPMRCICKAQGAALLYSEMVSAKGLWYGDAKTEKLLKIHEDEGPVAFQIFGSEPEIISAAILKLDKYKNVLIDINMGCPVPKVVKNGEGSALLKDPELIYELVRTAVNASEKAALSKNEGDLNIHPKPITVKIRKGWDDNNVNAVEVAKAVEAAGASAIAVHGRTREQFYDGKADWDIIKKVKNAVNIPVIGNGDIFTGYDAIEMMKQTDCDMVMIARGALGNPWIFREAVALYNGETVPDRPSKSEIIDMMDHHLEFLVSEKGEKKAVFEMRKHAAWYSKGMFGSAEFRRKINNTMTIEEMKQAFRML